MTDPSANPTPNDPESSHGPTGAGPSGEPSKASGATAIIDSLRDAIDDLAVRATPAVREVSARAAELTAEVAAKASPLAKKAGTATADASDKLAERSKTWAAGVRAAMDAEAPKAPTGEGVAGWGAGPTDETPEGTGSNGSNATNGTTSPADAPSGDAPSGDAPATGH